VHASPSSWLPSSQTSPSSTVPSPQNGSGPVVVVGSTSVVYGSPVLGSSPVLVPVLVLAGSPVVDDGSTGSLVGTPVSPPVSLDEPVVPVVLPASVVPVSPVPRSLHPPRATIITAACAREPEKTTKELREISIQTDLSSESPCPMHVEAA